MPGLTPSSSASRRTGGSAAPGTSLPPATARSTEAEISLAVDPEKPYCAVTYRTMYQYKSLVKGER
ncbi:hypothetical protein GCM10010273_50650 [Streptomyces lavendulocolor]